MLQFQRYLNPSKLGGLRGAIRSIASTTNTSISRSQLSGQSRIQFSHVSQFYRASVSASVTFREISTTSTTKFLATPKVGNSDSDSDDAPKVSDPIVPISLDVAKESPREFEEMSNEAIAIMAVCGEQEAKEERLIREIMRVDSLSWEEAQPKFRTMKSDNRKGMYIATIPYKIGLYTATISAFACIPMVFDLDTCMWFNEYYVTTEVPGGEDLETPLEVGSWAWNWMEPPLGTISFSLLCLQFARNQMQNLQATPYTEWVKNRRAARLCHLHPQYNSYIVADFAKNDKWGI